MNELYLKVGHPRTVEGGSPDSMKGFTMQFLYLNTGRRSWCRGGSAGSLRFTDHLKQIRLAAAAQGEPGGWGPAVWCQTSGWCPLLG